MAIPKSVDVFTYGHNLSIYLLTYLSCTPFVAPSRLRLPRVLEYTLRSISGCEFPFPVAVILQSVDELLEFMETWGFHFQLASLEIHLNIYLLVQGPDPTGPTYAGPPHALRHWQFELKYFRY